MHYENSKYKAEIDKVLAIQRETRSKLNSKLDLSKCILDSPLKLESEKEVTDQETKPQIRVTRILTTNLSNIDTVISNSPNSLWIADYLNSVLAHVQITNTSIQILSKFKMDVYDMAVDAHNNILLSVGGYDLKIFIKDNLLITCIKKLLNKSTWKICKFDYYLHIGLPSPRTSGIHVTSDRKLIIGAIKDGSAFIRRGQTIVTVNDMKDEERTCLQTYELDSNNKKLFTVPRKITSTSNGNIWVIDQLDILNRGRVVVLGQAGNIIQIYTGHHDVNNQDRAFRPTDLLTTPLDNIVVTDCNNHTLHILSCDGVFITYVRTDDIGIMWPCSLALSTPDHFYIGCVTPKGSPNKAKLYGVAYSGF
ncbi:uncharacterized protein [Mytilus edulis]|uniref:uncharacterized protein n=1 Tax=Mytilus edulis TaxID=6550 RepID=UPI0039F10E5D